MGGIGSGRRPAYGGKRIAEDALPLDVRRLQRDGVLTAGSVTRWQWTTNGSVRAAIWIHSDAHQIALAYTYSRAGRAAEAITQAVSLETTPCTLGGQRRWFACPTCTRRVAVLYGIGRLFACRRCKHVAYSSQNESDDDRVVRRINRIRRRLGWAAGILNDPGGKPVGMHWRTFRRLVARHDALLAVALEGMARQLGLVDKLLGEIKKTNTARGD